MPKSILNIDRFEGGINSNSDPKDITDSEVANAVDAKFSKIGQITVPGLAENVQDIQSLGDSGVVSGYGLSTFQSTHSLSEAETGTTFTGTLQQNGTNGLEPFFTIKCTNFHGHPIAHPDRSDSYNNAVNNNVIADGYQQGKDPQAAMENYGFRIHIGSDPYGTPDITYPSSSLSSGSTTVDVTDALGIVNTVEYNIIAPADGNKYIQMLPQSPSYLNSNPESNQVSDILEKTKKYFFTENMDDGTLKWDDRPGLLGSNPEPSSQFYDTYVNGTGTGLSFVSPQSNMLLTLAAIMDQDPDTTVLLSGDATAGSGIQNHYESLTIFINPNKFSGDFTPSNKYIWIEYKDYADSNLITDPNNSYTNVNSIVKGPGFGSKDYNFLNIPQKFDINSPAYNNTTIGPAAYQIQTNLTNNNAVTNLCSEGYNFRNINGNYVPIRTLSFKSARRVLPGLDSQAFQYKAALSASDGSDNAITGETYKIDISGPTVDTTFTASQVYAATGNDQLTEIIDSLDTQINATYHGDIIDTGDFSSGTDWSPATGWTIGSGLATCDGTNGATLTQDLSTELNWAANAYYKLTFTISAYTSGNLLVHLDTNTQGARFFLTAGTHVVFLKTPSSLSSNLITFTSNNFIGSIDNVSLLPANAGVPGITTTQTDSGKSLVLATEATGSHFDYQVTPSIQRAVDYVHKQISDEGIALVNDTSDLKLCSLTDGNWLDIFNNNNAHQTITAIANNSSLPQLTITGHGYVTNDLVVVKGTTDYDGLEKITKIDDNNFTLSRAYVSNTFQSDACVTKFEVTAANDKDTLIWPNSGALTQFYTHANTLRISDTNFDNTLNNPSTIEYISKTLFNQAGTTLPVLIEGWFVKNQHRKFTDYPTDLINSDWTANVNNADSNPGKFYINATTQAAGSLTAWNKTIKLYVTAVFDDGTETIPSFNNTQGLNFYDGSGYTLTISSSQVLRLNVAVEAINSDGYYAFDERIKGLRIYHSRADESHNAIYEVAFIDFKDGLVRGDGEGTVAWGPQGSTASSYAAQAIEIDFGEFKGNTFEFNAGYPAEDTIIPQVKWKTAVTVGNIAVVGNVNYDDGNGARNYPGRLLLSQPAKRDTFILPDGILVFGNEDEDIIRLETYADRILQYKKNRLDVINVTNLTAPFLEEEYRWKGVTHHNHVVWTTEGVIWANEYSVYLFDGRNITDLLYIKKGTLSETSSISQSDWSAFFSDTSVVMYDASENQIIIKRSTVGSSNLNNGDIYMYDLDKGGWSFGKGRFITKSATNQAVQTNAITTSDGSLYMLNSENLSTTAGLSNWGRISEGGYPTIKKSTV